MQTAGFPAPTVEQLKPAADREEAGCSAWRKPPAGEPKIRLRVAAALEVLGLAEEFHGAKHFESAPGRQLLLVIETLESEGAALMETRGLELVNGTADPADCAGKLLRAGAGMRALVGTGIAEPAVAAGKRARLELGMPDLAVRLAELVPGKLAALPIGADNGPVAEDNFVLELADTVLVGEDCPAELLAPADLMVVPGELV